MENILDTLSLIAKDSAFRCGDFQNNYQVPLFRPYTQPTSMPGMYSGYPNPTQVYYPPSMYQQQPSPYGSPYLFPFFGQQLSYRHQRNSVTTHICRFGIGPKTCLICFFPERHGYPWSAGGADESNERKSQERNVRHARAGILGRQFGTELCQNPRTDLQPSCSG